MFRNNFVLPETDINNLIDVKDLYYEKIEGTDIPVGAQAVDQFDSQPFMMAENGFRRSDIAILMSAQSDDLKRAVAARLQEVQASYPDQSLSDEQLAQLAIPRYVQSSSDFRDWAASLSHGGFAKAVDEYISKNKPDEPEKESIKFNEPQTE